MADYVPKRRAERRQWLNNIIDKVEVEGPKFGAPPADVTAVKALAVSTMAKIDDTDAAQTALDGVREIERTTEQTNIPQLRRYFRNWKTLPGFPASGSEAVLGLAASDGAVDPATYKPVIKVFINGGQITVDFDKKGVDGMAIYCRLRGTQVWRKLAVDTFAPYVDTMPLTQAGVPEVREYMARGVIEDEEIGLESDIVSITFGG